MDLRDSEKVFARKQISTGMKVQFRQTETFYLFTKKKLQVLADFSQTYFPSISYALDRSEWITLSDMMESGKVWHSMLTWRYVYIEKKNRFDLFRGMKFPSD